MKTVFQDSRTALGSQAIITLACSTEAEAAKLFSQLWRQITDFEQRFSRFLPSSELSKLNQSAGQPFVASQSLRRLLTEAIGFWRETDGIYNPAVLPMLVAAGYDRSFEELVELSNPPSNPTSNPRIHLDEIIIGKESVQLPFGMQLDFGGIGKGYLLDILADFLTPHCPNFWISLGGDILLSGTDQNDQSWQTSIQNPYQPETDLGSVASTPHGRTVVATSGTFKRKGTRAGKPWHHLIDPRTGAPSTSDLIACTVIGPRAVVADIYASCCVIVGSKQAEAMIEPLFSYNALCFLERGGTPICFGANEYLINWQSK